ncbi:MAG: 3-deoxy-7-phosphoheptulonate synthase [Candidatus Zixiibacteriota bacterium]
MLIVMDTHADPAQIAAVCAEVHALGLRAHPLPGAQRTAIGITGNLGTLDPGRFEAMPGVLRVIRVTTSYKLVSREFHPQSTTVQAGDASFGPGWFTVIAGPCAVETPEQLDAVARIVKQGGARLLRGGAFKPRTSPYSFQGLGESGLRILAEVGARHHLPVVTEAIDHESLELVAGYADMVQIGSRNMHNTPLLKKAGRCGKPVLLKRGMAATLEEFLMAAEYIMNEGNPNVVLCERGVRTFSDHARHVLDLSIVPVVRRTSHLPIIVDPSHGTGERYQVLPLACAAAAADADGIMVEVHAHPEQALSDGRQSIDAPTFDSLMERVGAMAAVVGRSL